MAPTFFAGCSCERGGDGAIGMQRSARELVAKSFALEIFRCDVELIVELLQRIDGGDSGVGERGGGAGFALEPLALMFPRRQLGSERFEGDRPVQAQARLLERLAALAVVAALAGGDEVLPGVTAPAMARHHVVERQVVRLPAAVLAGVTVTAEHLAA